MSFVVVFLSRESSSCLGKVFFFVVFVSRKSCLRHNLRVSKILLLPNVVFSKTNTLLPYYRLVRTSSFNLFSSSVLIGSPAVNPASFKQWLDYAGSQDLRITSPTTDVLTNYGSRNLSMTPAKSCRSFRDWLISILVTTSYLLYEQCQYFSRSLCPAVVSNCCILSFCS